MYIITPTEIPFVVWQGELVSNTGRLIPSSSVPPIAALGQIETWPIRDVLETVNGEWSPPQPDKDYWLLRQGFYLRQQSRVSNIMEAQLTLYLRPQHENNPNEIEATTLFPTMMNPEMPLKSNVALRLSLSFIGEMGLQTDESHAKIVYRRTFPIIRGYGAGSSAPYWIFHPQAHRALEGSQYVYAVISNTIAAKNSDITPELIVTVNTLRGPIRFGLPASGRARTRFKMPRLRGTGALQL